MSRPRRRRSETVTRLKTSAAVLYIDPVDDYPLSGSGRFWASKVSHSSESSRSPGNDPTHTTTAPILLLKFIDFLTVLPRREKVFSTLGALNTFSNMDHRSGASFRTRPENGKVFRGQRTPPKLMSSFWILFPSHTTTVDFFMIFMKKSTVVVCFRKSIQRPWVAEYFFQYGP